MFFARSAVAMASYCTAVKSRPSTYSKIPLSNYVSLEAQGESAERRASYQAKVTLACRSDQAAAGLKNKLEKE